MWRVRRWRGSVGVVLVVFTDVVVLVMRGEEIRVTVEADRQIKGVRTTTQRKFT